MKTKLMVQSMSLLALLTFIRNCSVVTVDDAGVELTQSQFVLENGLTLIVLGICVIWLLLAAAYYVSFVAFKWSGNETGYEIVDVSEKEGAGLDFFLTLIVPLIIDDVDTIQGFVSFILIIAIICCLLYQTNLFYANPVLAILGYRVYEFTFKRNAQFGEERCIGICRGKITRGQTIEYKEIADKVLYIKGM